MTPLYSLVFFFFPEKLLEEKSAHRWIFWLARKGHHGWVDDCTYRIRQVTWRVRIGLRSWRALIQGKACFAGYELQRRLVSLLFHLIRLKTKRNMMIICNYDTSGRDKSCKSQYCLCKDKSGVEQQEQVSLWGTYYQRHGRPNQFGFWGRDQTSKFCRCCRLGSGRFGSRLFFVFSILKF